MDDLNKSPLTCELTCAVALWMDEHGFKPVETEVGMPWMKENDKGWIADLAGIIVPTQTELIKLKIIKRNPPYSLRSPLKDKWEENPAYTVWSEERNRFLRLMTCLVEVKTTRSDFLGDRKWKSELPVDMAFVAIPKGLIEEAAWPEGWGVLEYEKKSVRIRRSPVPGVTTVENQLSVTLAIAIRRDHHTRYARSREWLQQDRKRRREEQSVTNMQRLARVILSIAKAEHESVEATLMFKGIHKPSQWLIEQLKGIHGIANKKA